MFSNELTKQDCLIIFLRWMCIYAGCMMLAYSYAELLMLQRLEAKSLFSACIAECWVCICFLLSSSDDEVGHSSDCFAKFVFWLTILFCPLNILLLLMMMMIVMSS